ncbi:hypothetical protein, partial [Salipiger mangrovisoli]|uniref:hypothetical protein n=1 Tax=Salipiger mangrovisoli TaxID=2865933 RepID=UPI001F11FBE7
PKIDDDRQPRDQRRSRLPTPRRGALSDLRRLCADQSDDIPRSTFPLEVWIDYPLKIAACIGCEDCAVPSVMDHSSETQTGESAVRNRHCEPRIDQQRGIIDAQCFDGAPQRAQLVRKIRKDLCSAGRAEFIE